MDVHKEEVVIAVLNGAGQLVIESIVETKASSLLQFIHGLQGELHVTWEEGTWAAWLYDLLKPHIHQVLVCNPPRNDDLSACYESIGDSQVAFGEGIGALASYRQAIKIREQLSAKDPENAEARTELAQSYAKLGQAYMALASNPKIRSSNRAEQWREARSWLQTSLKLWTIMRENGTLPGNDAS